VRWETDSKVGKSNPFSDSQWKVRRIGNTKGRFTDLEKRERGGGTKESNHGGEGCPGSVKEGGGDQGGGGFWKRDGRDLDVGNIWSSTVKKCGLGGGEMEERGNCRKWAKEKYHLPETIVTSTAPSRTILDIKKVQKMNKAITREKGCIRGKKRAR